VIIALNSDCSLFGDDSAVSWPASGVERVRAGTQMVFGGKETEQQQLPLKLNRRAYKGCSLLLTYPL